MKLFCTNNLSTVDECRHDVSIALPDKLQPVIAGVHSVCSSRCQSRGSGM